MIGFSEVKDLYVVTGATDLRKGIDGYAGIVKSRLGHEPTDHSMYLFCNRDHTKLKCLYYDGTGFWLLYKRLEHGHFKWKIGEKQTSVTITEHQFHWLLEGLKMEQKSAFKKLEKDFC